MNQSPSSPKNRAHFIIVIIITGIAAITLTSAWKPEKTLFDSPSPVISPNIPGDVSVPGGFSGNPITFFDDYSWRAFIGLVWPAKEGQRGMPDINRPLGSTGPLVFETLKADWEIFHENGSSPGTDWNSFSDPVPCAVTGSFGFDDLALVSTSKFGNLGQAGFGNLVGPIVAQNNTYVRYLTGFNQLEFDKIMQGQLYLQANLKNVTFPDGSIDVKSSWIEMKGVQHPERYYTREAWIFEPTTNTCQKQTIGLVGLHIAQKTPTRPQWIWSTFEQVDNIPQDGAIAGFAFHNGTNESMPINNPFAFPPPDTPNQVFNIQRGFPINPSTVVTNKLYQEAVKAQGNSVWQFYQLVLTQWPTATPPNAALPGIPANTFPGTNPPSAFSNITMETFDQKRIQTGCMNCHNTVKGDADFLWSLKINAFPSVLAQNATLRLQSAKPQNKQAIPVDQSILKLKNLLEQNQK